MFDRLSKAGFSKTVGAGSIQHIHFIGIGGSGMSGIAELLFNLGFKVTGSDMVENAGVQRLSSLGIEVFIGHEASHISGADVVVVSTAVNELNPEIIEARSHRLPVVRRAEMLAELMRFRYGIAVAGTHGKTTTTSLTASLLAEAGLDPTFVIGGKLNSAGTNAALGEGKYLVAEADESDASFLFLQPMIAVVTNIDADHMSTYQGDFEQLKQTFSEFLQHLPFYGLSVMCIDDDVVRELVQSVSRPVRTYGISEDADVRATNISQDKTQTRFDVEFANGEVWKDLLLNLPGRHNVQNALAAISVATELGVDKEPVARALKEFKGIGRRFQVYGQLSLTQGEALLVDDYGHHPAEIQATLQALRAGWPQRRSIVVFQPHRYSRTRDLFDDFVKVLATTDVLILLSVYPAGEAPIPNADSHSLIQAIRLLGHQQAILAEDINEVPELLDKVGKQDDVLITMGAGSVGQVPALLQKMFKLTSDVC